MQLEMKVMKDIDKLKHVLVQQAEEKRSKEWLASIGEDRYRNLVLKSTRMIDVCRELNISPTLLRYYIRHNLKLRELTRDARNQAMALQRAEKIAKVFNQYIQQTVEHEFKPTANFKKQNSKNEKEQPK